MSILSSIIAANTRPPQPFVLLQSSSAAQSALPILQHLLANAKGNVVLVSFLYPPNIFAGYVGQQQLKILDYTAYIPQYHDDSGAWKQDILIALEKLDSSAPLTVVIDSLETMLSDASDSVSSVYVLISKVLTAIQAHKGNSRLIVHGVEPSSLTSLLAQPSFSPTLTHVIAHPPVLLKHLASSYSTPPPPLTTPERFWSVFSPIADRGHDNENLVFGSDGEGYGGNELVVELVIRGTGEGRRRAVERSLAGWIVEGEFKGPCELKSLPSLSSLWTRKGMIEEAVPDPTKSASFNLSLTPEQQQSRAQVPLPYAHDSVSSSNATSATTTPEGLILYDPDSADDIDDDDPDEDLDI